MPFRARLPSWAGQCQTHTLCTYSITSRESFVHSFAAHKSDKWLACHFLLPTARDHAKAYLQESDVYLPAYCLLLSHAKPTHESLIYAPAASCLIRPCKASLQGVLCLPLLAYCLWLLACHFLLTAVPCKAYSRESDVYAPAASCLLLTMQCLLARRLMTTCKEAYDCF